jgi:DNA-binding transcriptional ArsR family regulator
MEIFAKNLVTTQRYIVLARKIEKNFGKIVTSRTLDAISWVSTVHPGNLGRRERHLFWVLLALLRMEPAAEFVRCTVGHLASVLRRVGLEGSPSTIRRALSSLEALGFLSRRRCRLGPDRLGLLIQIHRDRWQFWLKPRQGCQKPPTSVYIPPRQSIGPGEDRTTTTQRVDLPNSVESRYKPQKSGKKIHRYHPIVYTLLLLLKRQGASDRKALIRRAEAEIALEASGLEVVNHSGIPWEQYERAWRDMSVATREPFAAAEIVPRLRAALERPDVGGDLELLDDDAELGHDQDDAGVELEQLVGNLGALCDVGTVVSTPPPTRAPRWFPGPSGPDKDGLSTPQTPPPPDAGVNLLDDETRAVLERARERCRARACKIDD